MVLVYALREVTHDNATMPPSPFPLPLGERAYCVISASLKVFLLSHMGRRIIGVISRVFLLSPLVWMGERIEARGRLVFFSIRRAYS